MTWCGVALGADDLTRADWFWGLGAGAAGLLTHALMMRASGRREVRYREQAAALALSQHAQSELEERFSRLVVAVEDAMRARLMTLAGQTKPKGRFRITVYSHRADAREFVRRGRYSPSADLQDDSRSRRVIPDAQGLIGEAMRSNAPLRKGVTFERSQESSSRELVWETFMRAEGLLPDGVLVDPTMHPFQYVFVPISDPSDDRLVGMLVVECEDRDGVRLRGIRDDRIGVLEALAPSQRELAAGLKSIEEAIQDRDTRHSQTATPAAQHRPSGPGILERDGG